ncbi:MAG: rRNA maturation RNase YbeY [Candidatus Omnitrophota bacterium]|nr:MAG: rRNA maturation RNase YbeY [Candidatus Omnitrophota bacterium]
MPLKIEINNLNKKRRLNQKVIKKTALFVLRSFKKHNALIDITFVSDRKIKILNKKYMARSGSTDVLTFLLEEIPLPRRNLLIGDIYISSDRAYENAGRFKTNFSKEILLYTIHGILHLVGFEDRTVNGKNRIRKLEEKFLNRLRFPVQPVPAKRDRLK